MKQIYKITIISFTLFLFVGCTQTKIEPPLYTWNNYVESSGQIGTEDNQKEAIEKHQVVLEKIILDSNNEKKRVAPGIYAEYAQFLFESNKKDKAKKYFILEKITYPESTVFIDRVIKKLYGENL
ncbi:MAG: DUF4810 domain-containing protein [Arcobacter sp.]|uniref:DUF4810 domain-containing protein n=1 Tax=Arcobacter sp. TaxID=1872629 RepID=UPI003AFF7D26